MHIGIYQAGQGMRAQWEAQQNIAANLARQAEIGHRRALTIQTHGSSQESAQKTKADRTPAFSPIETQSYIDFSQGSIQPSDDSLHLAIQGNAFFSIHESNGETSYTRNGQFKLSSDGKVITPDGAELLIDGGNPLKIKNKFDLLVSAQGIVTEGSQQLGTLELAHFEKPAESLIEIGNGRFRLKEGAQKESGAPSATEVLQYHLETSNSQPVGEMVSMIHVMRTYEAQQRSILTEDEATGKLLRTTGSTS